MRGSNPNRGDPCLISLALVASPQAPLGYRQIFIHNGGSDPFFALLRRSTRPNFPRLEAGFDSKPHRPRSPRAGVSLAGCSLAGVWTGRRGGRKTLQAAARETVRERDGSSCWGLDPGILDFLGPFLGYGSFPPHHQPRANNSGRSLQVGRLERPKGGRPTRRLAWSCGGDVFNGGVVCLPPGLGSTMESCRRETAMSLDYPTLTLATDTDTSSGAGTGTRRNDWLNWTGQQPKTKCQSFRPALPPPIPSPSPICDLIALIGHTQARTTLAHPDFLSHIIILADTHFHHP